MVNPSIIYRGSVVKPNLPEAANNVGLRMVKVVEAPGLPEATFTLKPGTLFTNADPKLATDRSSISSALIEAMAPRILDFFLEP